MNEKVEGVQLPSVDGKRSSQAVGREVFAAAARPVDQRLARDIEAARNWRKDYIGHVGALVRAGLNSTSGAEEIARAGLHAVHERLVFADDGVDKPLRDVIATHDGDGFVTETIHGEGREDAEVVIPYRGKKLRGDDLRRQLDDWERGGSIEPGCADALRTLLDSPDWLDLSDLRFAILGAASEMGPLPSLARWGAEIVALDLPRPTLWDQVISVARSGRGRLHIPVRAAASDPQDISRSAGVDLLVDTPRARAWLRSFEGPMTIGNYVYADGAGFVRLAGAVDVLIEDLCSRRNDVSLAYLATPTDVYAVPAEVIDGSKTRRPTGPRRIVHRAVRGSSMGRLYCDNYRDVIELTPGAEWAISDALVPQQGPNYALAKHLQRWRAIAARSAGRVSSVNLAPATRTRSVVKNRLLAAAYAGAPRFGLEIFEPHTSSALMAALLVHDLRDPKSAAHPEVELDHPYALMVRQAAHGGLLRLPYEPRSLLPLAVMRGLARKS